MKNRTKIKYHLACMMGYINDIEEIIAKYDTIDEVFREKINKYAINFCLVQLGEHARNIKAIGEEQLLNDLNLPIPQINALRNRIVHSYGNIDYNVLSTILIKDLPVLKTTIEKEVVPPIIEAPYILFEREYEDIEGDKSKTTRKKKHKSR